MSMTEDQLRQYRELAERGDSDAQLALAWEYYYARRDFDAGLQFFRQAKQKKPGLACFYLARAKILLGDETFKEVIPDHYVQGFGPAFYLMGVAKQQGRLCEKNINEAIRYFSLAARDNHLISEFLVWRFQKKGIWRWLITFPWSARLCIRIATIKVRNPDDVRILT